MSKTWPKVRLGAIVDDLTVLRTFKVMPEQQVLDPTIKSATHTMSVGGYNIGSGVRITRRVRIEPGDLVFSRLHTQNGAFAFADQEYQATGTFIPMAVNDDIVDRRFLFWALHVYVPLMTTSDTVGRETYKTADILSLEIPLPPLSEQRRIVARIDQLADRIEEARGLRKMTVEEAEAFLRSISRRIFTTAKKYGNYLLNEVCTDIIDCLHSNPVYSDDGIPTVRSPDVGWGRLMLHSSLKTSEAEYRRRTRRGDVRPGHIIIVREGGGTGKAGIVEEGQRVSLGQRVMQICPDRQKVTPRFFLHQWLSPVVQEDLIAPLMKGSASPHLNIGAIKQFSVILPPMEEQHRIAAYLDDLQARVDSLKRLQANTAAELDALLPSVLDKAFRGEL